MWFLVICDYAVTLDKSGKYNEVLIYVWRGIGVAAKGLGKNRSDTTFQMNKS